MNEHAATATSRFTPGFGWSGRLTAYSEVKPILEPLVLFPFRRSILYVFMQHSFMDLRLRAYCANDFEFARGLYFQTMRLAIERTFGWDQAFQEASFAEWFKADEISIIVADGADVGWIQQRLDGEAIFLGSIYIAPAMQRKGIGTWVIQATLDSARLRHQVVTLAVMRSIRP